MSFRPETGLVIGEHFGQRARTWKSNPDVSVGSLNRNHVSREVNSVEADWSSTRRSPYMDFERRVSLGEDCHRKRAREPTASSPKPCSDYVSCTERWKGGKQSGVPIVRTYRYRLTDHNRTRTYRYPRSTVQKTFTGELDGSVSRRKSLPVIARVHHRAFHRRTTLQPLVARRHYEAKQPVDNLSTTCRHAHCRRPEPSSQLCRFV
jgi:hypothetical protein